MSKMNQIDRAWRNERDVLELLEIADKATSRNVCALDQVSADLRTRYEAIRDRRTAQDNGQTVG